MTRIWIHLIIYSSTSFLRDDEENWKNAKTEIVKHSLQENIVINSINGTSNHLHLIIWLGEKQTVIDTTNLLKQISKTYLIKFKLADSQFRWLDEYMAFSVSDLLLELEKHCISTQSKYHETKELKDEISLILQECKINYE